MQSRILTWSLATFVVAGVVLAAADTGAPSLEQRVEHYLQPYLDIGHLSGTLLIAREDQVLYEKSFGLANHEHDIPNTVRTLFCVGSINKPMTTVILARLLETLSCGLLNICESSLLSDT